MHLDELCKAWMHAKRIESENIENRRDIEDQIVEILKIAKDFDGTRSVFDDESGFSLKIVGRLTRKVDADKLQELAIENGLTDHLSTLFRWKPDLNMAAWKAADATLVKPLLSAITTTPSRPSFSIEQKGK